MKAPDPVDGYFDALQGEEGGIARSLRALVRSVAPSLQEGLKWHQPVHTGRRNVCCIAAEGDHVKLGFFRGGHLSDPEELLGGTGKAMRQVKVRSAGDVPKDALRSLLQEAVALDEEGPQVVRRGDEFATGLRRTAKAPPDRVRAAWTGVPDEAWRAGGE